MKIAFYAPLKSPNHPVPSGDRLMARLLMQAMTMGGHEVSVASELRSFLKQPDEPARTSLAETAEREIETITQRWQLEGAPDLWFCYHPYYKALDLLGPELARRFDIPYVTAEASYSPKRNGMGWQVVQDRLLAALNVASINICLTARDREGLVRASPALRWAMLPPFIDAEAFLKNTPNPTPAKLIAVAMMRAGDKLDSYRALAEALALCRRISTGRWISSAMGRNARPYKPCSALFRISALSGTGKKPRPRSPCFFRKRHSMSGRAMARPMGLPISKRRPPACPSWPKRWRVFPKW